MPDLKFQIDSEDAKAAVQEALMGVLTPAKRDELVRGAIEQLLKGNWQTSSELQQIFANGARSVAREVFAEEFAKPEVRAKIRELVVAAFEGVFEKDRLEPLVEKLGDSIAKALGGDRY